MTAIPDGEPQESVRRFTLHHVVPGTVGSLLLAFGSFGVGWLPINTSIADQGIVHSLRFGTIGTVSTRFAVLIGMALLIQSWLVLGTDVMHGRAPALGRLGTLLCAWSLPLAFVPPLFSRDVYSYFVQGKLIAHGLNPYVHGVIALPGWFNDGADPTWGASPTPYGPLFLLIERGVATAVQEHPLTAAMLFRVASLIGVWLLWRFVPRLAFLGGIDARKAVWLAVLNPVVLMHFVADSHNDSLMIGLLVAGLTLVGERAYYSGIALIALGAAVKPIGLLLLPFAGMLHVGTHSSWSLRVRAWSAAVGITAAIFVVLSALVAVGPGWVPALLTPGGLHTWLAPATGLGLGIAALLRFANLGDHSIGLVTFTHAIGILIAVLLVARLVLHPVHRSPVRTAGLAFLAVVAFAPTVQPWYLIWCLPLFACSGLNQRYLRWVIIATAGLGVHGLVTSAAASSSLVRFSPGAAILAAGCVIAGILLISRRERSLVLGMPLDSGLHPDDAPARSRAVRISN